MSRISTSSHYLHIIFNLRTHSCTQPNISRPNDKDNIGQIHTHNDQDIVLYSVLHRTSSRLVAILLRHIHIGAATENTELNQINKSNGKNGFTYLTKNDFLPAKANFHPEPSLRFSVSHSECCVVEMLPRTKILIRALLHHDKALNP